MQIRTDNGVHDLLTLALNGGPATFFRALRCRPLDIVFSNICAGLGTAGPRLSRQKRSNLGPIDRFDPMFIEPCGIATFDILGLAVSRHRNA